MAKKGKVRRPLVQFDARGIVDTHGIQKPVRIVIHTTECPDSPGIRDLRGVVRFWERQGRGLGAHLVIDRDGNSALAANPHQITYAVEGRNTGTVHIELVAFAKYLPKIWWLRIPQLNKTAKWIAWLNLEYGIPIRFDTNFGVSGHRDQPKQSHWDPGIGFPMKYVINKARMFREFGWK